MTNIIKVTKNEIGNAELNSVNARDIHNYLQVNSKFADWIKRAISKYDFKENIDYTVLKNEKKLNDGVCRPFTDYIVTMDMAKELAMLENNPKGKETRKYFIDCEKKLNSNSANNEKYFELFSNGFNSLTKAMENQQIQINNLTNVVMNLSNQNSCDITQNEQSNKKLIKNKDTKNTGFKISRDFTDFYDLNYIELEILKVLIEKNEFLDKKVIDDKNYYKLTLKMMVEFSSVKTSEKTLQRHSLSLREKKVLDCVNKIDGNYLKISDEALEFLGGAR